MDELTPVAEKLGIENLKLAAKAVAKIGNGIGGVFEDGKVNAFDVVHLPTIFGGLTAAGQVDFAKLMPEAKDVDEAERPDLAKTFKDEFKLANVSQEQAIEMGFEILTWGLQALSLLAKVRGQVQGPVKPIG